MTNEVALQRSVAGLCRRVRIRFTRPAGASRDERAAVDRSHLARLNLLNCLDDGRHVVFSRWANAYPTSR